MAASHPHHNYGPHRRLSPHHDQPGPSAASGSGQSGRAGDRDVVVISDDEEELPPMKRVKREAAAPLLPPTSASAPLSLISDDEYSDSDQEPQATARCEEVTPPPPREPGIARLVMSGSGRFQMARRSQRRREIAVQRKDLGRCNLCMRSYSDQQLENDQPGIFKATDGRLFYMSACEHLVCLSCLDTFAAKALRSLRYEHVNVYQHQNIKCPSCPALLITHLSQNHSSLFLRARFRHHNSAGERQNLANYPFLRNGIQGMTPLFSAYRKSENPGFTATLATCDARPGLSKKEELEALVAYSEKLDQNALASHVKYRPYLHEMQLDGNTPLIMLAARRTVRNWMLSNYLNLDSARSQINRPNLRGQTALIVLITNASVAVEISDEGFVNRWQEEKLIANINLLVSQGADVHHRDNSGSSIFDHLQRLDERDHNNVQDKVMHRLIGNTSWTNYTDSGVFFESEDNTLEALKLYRQTPQPGKFSVSKIYLREAATRGFYRLCNYVLDNDLCNVNTAMAGVNKVWALAVRRNDLVIRKWMRKHLISFEYVFNDAQSALSQALRMGRTEFIENVFQLMDKDEQKSLVHNAYLCLCYDPKSAEDMTDFVFELHQQIQGLKDREVFFTERMEIYLYSAVMYGNLTVIRKLSDRYAWLMDFDHTYEGTTLLMLAAMNDDIDIVRYLLRVKRVNAHVEDWHGNSALDMTCHPEIRKALAVCLEPAPSGSPGPQPPVTSSA